MFTCPECGDEVDFIYTESEKCVDCVLYNVLEEEEIMCCDQCLVQIKRSIDS